MIIRLSILFLLCVSYLFSNDDIYKAPLQVTDTDHSGIVNDSVNVITGNFSIFCTDIVIPGAEPIKFERFYTSADTHGTWDNWHNNHISNFRLNDGDVDYVDFFGSSVPLSQKSKQDYYFNTLTNGDGFTNTAGGAISAKTNLKNLICSVKKGDKKGQIKTGSGEMYLKSASMAISQETIVLQ